MPQETFDRIFKGGTVVNQDGEGLRDVGVTDGRIVTIGNLDADQAGDVIDCTGSAHPARRDRQPGAFPRARCRAQRESGNRVTRRRYGRGDLRVRNAQHQPDHHR
jgi:hypothetical protein